MDDFNNKLIKIASVVVIACILAVIVGLTANFVLWLVG